MRNLPFVLSALALFAFLGAPAKASSDLARMALEFEVAWTAAGGPAPPLGVSLVTLTEDERFTLGITDGRGIRLTAVDAGSLGERLGLKVNDIVVSLNGNSIRSGEEFVNLVRARDPAVTPYFELFTSNSSNPPAADVSAPQTDSMPIDCGPNPTLECAMQLLRDSWSKLREAVR